MSRSAPASHPPHARRTRVAAWLVASLLLLAAPHADVVSGEKLTPIASGRYERTDQMGFQWDFNANGSIRDGTNDCFDGGLELRIDGRPFRETPPAYQTTDGGSMVVRGSVGSIGIERRIHVDLGRGAARFVEILENRGKQPAQVTVEVVSNLGSTARLWNTNLGRDFSGGGELLKKEWAFLAAHGRGSRPAVLHAVTAPRSRVAPTITVDRRRTITCRWVFEVPPKRRVSLLHSVLQRRWPVQPPQETVQAELQPLLARSWARGLPRHARAAILNHPGSYEGDAQLGTQSAPATEEVLALAHAYELERGEQDIVVLGEEKHLRGTVSGGPLHVESRHGAVQIPLEEVAVLWGGANRGRSMRLYLRNGEILAGAVRAAALRFASPAGIAFDLRAAAVDAIFLRAHASDGRADVGVQAFVTLLEGTKLGVLASDDARLQAVTPWGEIDVPLSAVNRIIQTREPVAGSWMQLAGPRPSRFPVALTTAAVRMPTRRFGPIDLEAAAIASLTRLARDTPEAGRTEDDDETTGSPYAVLLAECRLAGAIALKQIHVVSTTGATPIPIEQIASIEREDMVGDEGAAIFEVTLHGDEEGRLQGALRERLLPFDTPHGRCHVPLAHLLRYRAPPPAAPPGEAADSPADDAPGAEPAEEGDK